MLKRGYCPIYQGRFPTYVGCSVCKEWLLFSNFKGWMEKQDWEGKELDKDLLVEGNKVYSEATCVFVSSDINKLLASHEKARGIYPRGVTLHKRTGRYQASCSFKGKQHYLGLHKTICSAEAAYCTFKAKVVTERSYAAGVVT